MDIQNNRIFPTVMIYTLLYLPKAGASWLLSARSRLSSAGAALVPMAASALKLELTHDKLLGYLLLN